MVVGVFAIGKMLMEYFFDVEVVGYETWHPSFVCNKDGVFIVFVKVVNCGCGIGSVGDC